MGDVSESKVSELEKSCETCSVKTNLKACTGCYAVFYCSFAHQKANWKLHRPSCSAVQKSNILRKASESENVVVLLEVKSAQGRGLGNHVINHFFDTKKEALKHVANSLQTSRENANLTKLTEMPFLTQVMGWTECELFANPNSHEFYPEGHFLRCCGFKNREDFGPNGGERTLNGLAVYLGVTLTTGLSPFSDILGTVFFMGKRNGRYVSGNMLHGAMLMIFDATEEFGSDDDCSLEFKVFEKWGRNYAVNRWTPMFNDPVGEGDIYSHELEENTSTGKAIHRYGYEDHRAQ